MRNSFIYDNDTKNYNYNFFPRKLRFIASAPVTV